jgi:predicted SnoaL-like aldol condensation-catalyzing enzyme
MGFMDQRPRDAFERYASADMVEHKPDVPLGTRAAVASYLEQLIGALPKAKWEMLRAASEADLVYLHGRFTADPGIDNLPLTGRGDSRDPDADG